MKTAEQIRSKALLTHDPSELYDLLEQALELAAFEASRAEFSQAREQKLKQQVSRQSLMITNLENTLWKNK